MVYIKHNSFNDIKIDEKCFFDVKKLLQTLKYKREYSSNTHKNKVIDRAIEDLESENDDPCKFTILPHIKEEIERLKEGKLIDYFYYRFKYDIYPKTFELDDYPPVVQIEPASICNYRCVFCFQTDRSLTKKSNGHMGYMSYEIFKKVIDELENNVHSITLASRGEPLLNKELGNMLMYMKNKFVSIKINTNASMLTEKLSRQILESGVHNLVFSADAANNELYKKMRVNGDLNKVLRNIKQFNEIRRNEFPQNDIITRVSGVRYREDQCMEDMKSLWGSLVDQVAFVNYNPWENTYIAKRNGLNTPCSDLWRRMFVWWDGKCNPCDVDYLTTLKMGNAKVKSIKSIWTGSEYTKLRKDHLENKREKVDPCSRCASI